MLVEKVFVTSKNTYNGENIKQMEQQIMELELNNVSLEQNVKLEIQTVKEEILYKLDALMQYDLHLP